MDAKLLSDYQAAVRARVIVERLPSGLREYAQRYEALCLADLRAQAGREVTETELMATAKPTVLSILQDLWPVLSPIVLAAVKKYALEYQPYILKNIFYFYKYFYLLQEHFQSLYNFQLQI